jgi:hypothetical protein
MRRAMGLGRIVRGAFATRASSLRVDGTGAPFGRAAIALCSVTCALGLLAPPAGAATPTHAELPALNQTGFERACGLAVDSVGNRYVADYGADQVKVYSSAGALITSFTPSANAESPCALAVDSNGNLYVNGKNTDVVKYKPSAFPPTASTTYAPDTSVNGTGVLVPEEAKGVAVNSATDDVYVPFFGHISSYEPDGTPISETLGEEATGGGASFISVAVRGSNGKIYAYNRTGKKAYVLSADGSQVLAEVNGSTTKGASFPIAPHTIAVDQSNGHFYIADIGGATGHKVVDEFDSGGELVSEIATPSALEEDSPSALAVDNSGGENDGDVFVSAGVSPSSVLAFGPLTYAEFFELKVTKVGAGQGTVTSAPAGIDCGTTCKVTFQEGTEVTLSAVAAAGSKFSRWEGCDTVVGSECKVTMAAKHQVTARFTAKPAIETESVSPRDTSALLEATVNPSGEETNYQFEFLSEAAYQANGESFSGPEEPLELPASPELIGNGDAGVPVSATVSELTPDTPYRFRVVASNPAGITPGKAIAFTTYSPPNVFKPCSNDAFRAGQPSAQLPDCRAYEQASPVDKNGGDVTGTVITARASVDGERVSFVSATPIPGGEGAANYAPMFLASRGPSGWSTQGLLPPQSDGIKAVVVGWNPDFSQVISRAAKYAAGEAQTTLLERSTSTPGAPTAIVPRSAATGYFEPHVAGTSDDGSVVFFESKEGVLAEGAAAGRRNLYVWDRETGAVRLAGALNDGKAPPKGSIGGPYSWEGGYLEAGGPEWGYYTRDQHAIAPDGSSVYFTAVNTGQLYLRLNPTKPQSPLDAEGECSDPSFACTIQVSASQKHNGDGLEGNDGAGPHPAAFMGASADDSKAFFTSSEMLTNNANTGPEQPAAAIGRAKVGATEAEEAKPGFLPAHAVGVATSPDGEYVYWTDPTAGTIGRAKLNGDGQASEVEDGFISPGPTEFETHPKLEPGVLQSAPSTPRYVAVEGEYVYWTNTGPLVSYQGGPEQPVEGAGTIGRAKLDGSGALIPGSVEPEFITEATDPQGITVNSEHIYWVNGDGGGFGEQIAEPSKDWISRSNLAGNAVQLEFYRWENVGAGYRAEAIALDESHLYFTVTTGNGSTSINRVPLEGGPEEAAYIAGDFDHKTRLEGLAIQGSYVYWTNAGEERVGRLPTASFTGSCDAGNPECEPDYIELEGVPAGLASDGERLYWATNGEASANPGNDLYRYSVAKNKLVDLVPDSTHPDGAEVLGVAGISEDGSYVYFVANSALAEGASPGTCEGAVPEDVKGECSLYLEHEGQVDFIARLNGERDFGDWKGKTSGSSNVGFGEPKLSRVSANGRTLLFSSTEKLTGYQNEGTQELYLYRADAAEQIVCISCNPTGVPPSSAASMGITASVSTEIEGGRSAPVLTRNLSADGGRVFFETAEALVVSDTNADEGCPSVGEFHVPACQDVYEWEAKGEGSCESEDQNGGCLYLISSGKSADPSFLADASASGNDVFFFTREQLTDTDDDSLQDVYDARVGGGFAAKPVPPPPCEGEACRDGAHPAPQVGSPNTPLFSGPGNPKPQHKKPKARKHRHKHKRHAKSNGRAHR